MRPGDLVDDGRGVLLSTTRHTLEVGEVQAALALGAPPAAAPYVAALGRVSTWRSVTRGELDDHSRRCGRGCGVGDFCPVGRGKATAQVWYPPVPGEGA